MRCFCCFFFLSFLRSLCVGFCSPFCFDRKFRIVVRLTARNKCINCQRSSDNSKQWNWTQFYKIFLRCFYFSNSVGNPRPYMPRHCGLIAIISSTDFPICTEKVWSWLCNSFVLSVTNKTKKNLFLYCILLQWINKNFKLD